eukprot:7149172-Prymnesium_polylepis.1
MEAGVDSLGAVEFRSRLSSKIGDVRLPETLIFDHPTLRQVNTHVSSLLVAGSAGQGEAESVQDEGAEPVDEGGLLQLLASALGSTPRSKSSRHIRAPAPSLDVTALTQQ